MNLQRVLSLGVNAGLRAGDINLSASTAIGGGGIRGLVNKILIKITRLARSADSYVSNKDIIMP